MKLTDRLYQCTKEIWDGYLKHPFIQELADGTLPIKKFRYYMVQDYIYLLDYARVHAMGVVKAKDEETMQEFASLVNDILNGEMGIHKRYMGHLNITKEEIASVKPALDNVSYTSYMLWVSANGTALELAVTILACSWSYKVIGDKCSMTPGSPKTPFYGEWIKGYSSREYAKSNDRIIKMVNKLGEGISEEQEENLKQIFITCSQYEARFWDMAYEMRT